jgi:cell division protein FtsL
MTSVSLTRAVPLQSVSTLSCQQVGGYPARASLAAILAVGLLVGASLIYVWSRTEVVREGYALSRLAKEIKSSSSRAEQLRAEALSLRAPERIEAIAKERLGLQYPTQEQIRIVESSPGAEPAARTEALAARSQGGGQ